MPPPTPLPGASYPVAPPAIGFPLTEPSSGKLTAMGREMFTQLWAAIGGAGGVVPSIQELQAEVAIIFGMHGDGTLSADGVLTVTKTNGVAFGPYATATTLPIATVAAVGVVKPDGTTITIDPDGTIHSAGGGGVSITASTGIVVTPSPITGTGTVGLATVADSTLLANVSGGVAAPTPQTLSAVFDHVLGNTRGDLIYRGASAWSALAPGATANLPLVTGGAGADPAWATNVNVPGWLNVGSTAAPANTTPGDVTGLRLFIGDNPAGGTRISAYYDVTAFPAGSSVAFNFFARGAADPGGTTVLSAANLISEITGGNNANQLFGFKAEAWMAGTGTLNLGVAQSIVFRNLAAGTTTDARALNASVLASAGTITTAQALYAGPPSISGSGAVGTAYGARIKGQKVTGVTKGYGVYSEGTSDLNVIAGATTIGSAVDPAASVALDVVSTTGAFRPPSMTTTQRLALTPLNGMVVYDSTLNQFYAYQNSLWIPIIWASGGTARNSAQFNVIITSQLTASAACHGNIMKPAVNITVTGAGFSMTTVTGGVYAVGIAPYDTGTNKITAAPTYTTTYTETAGAAHTPVFLNFPTPVTLTGGTSYIVFMIRTDSTSSVGQTMDYSTGLQTAPAFYVPATGTLAILASLAPTTSDTWTVTGTGVRNLNFAYQL